MEQDIEKLVKETTIIRGKNNKNSKVEVDEDYPMSRHEKNHLINYNKKLPVDLKSLEKYWIEKWKSFGNKWNDERQDYRFFHGTFKLFYYSFYQLKRNKNVSITSSYEDNDKTNLYNQLAAVNLYGVYHHGKKCVDLVKKLKLDSTLDNKEKDFINRFSGTRNKFIEHNFNPWGFNNKRIDPSILSLKSSNSFMDIKINGDKEREYDVKIDYYEDYYNLEDILVKIIKTF